MPDGAIGEGCDDRGDKAGGEVTWLHAALHGVPIFLARWTATGDWSISACTDGARRFGIDPDHAREQAVRYRDLIHPDDLPGVTTGVEAFLAAGAAGVHRCVYRLAPTDGRELWVEEHTHARRGADGVVHELFGVVADVTEHVETYQMLAKAEASHQALLDALPFNVARIDLEGRLTFVNDRLARAYGASREQLLGRSTFELHPREVAVKNAAADAHAMRSGQVSFASVHNAERDTHHDVIRVPIRSEHGEVEGLQIVSIDRSQETRARQDLEASEARYRQLFEASLSGFALHEVVTDDEGRPIDYRFLDANPAWERFTGLAIDDVRGRTVLDVLPDTEPFWIERLGAVALSGTPDQFTGYAAALGRHFEVYAYQNAPRQFAVLAHDVSARRSRELELQRLSLAVEQGPSLVLITDPDGVIEYVNQRYLDVTGFARDDLIGTPSTLLGYATRAATKRDDMWSTLHSGRTWVGTYEGRARTGEPYWAQVRVAPVMSAEGTLEHYVALMEDLTEQRQLTERVAFLAYHDELTGLPNRTLFLDRVQQALLVSRRGQRPVALVMIGIDDLTAVNVAYGHAGGDEVIIEIARRISGCVRPGDTVARFTGDQFLVLLTGLMHRDDAALVAQAIVEAAEAPVALERGDSVFVTVSVGVATHEPDAQSDTDADLVTRAEVAMRRAKHDGRGHYRFFSEALDTAAAERIRLEHDLFRAVERHELVLEYQPRVDLSSGSLVSLEALVRWDHPEHGRLPPGRFVPAAERSKAIVALGAEVRRLAVDQMRRWRDAGMALVPVAVNVSGRELVAGGVLESLCAALAESDVEAGWLEVEVTESAVMAPDPQVLQQLQGLEDLGVRVSIDDFGTAYSSLGRLKHLPVSCLKIDRSFIRDLGTPVCDDGPDAAIVRAVLRLGEALGLDVIAEGVETDEQAAFLRRNGCRLAQGYLFARPLAAQEVEPWLRLRGRAS